MRLTKSDVIIGNAIDALKAIARHDIEEAHGATPKNRMIPNVPADIYREVIASVESWLDENERGDFTLGSAR